MQAILKRLKKPMYVDTPNGKKPFTGIARYIKEVLKIETYSGYIEAAEKHIFVIDDTEIFAKDLKIGDKLQTKDGYTVVQKITPIGKKEVFDLTNVEGKVYYTNNILSHNTFAGSSYTLIEASTLRQLASKEVIATIDGKLKVYYEYEKEHQYICSVDPAKDGIDGFVVNFIDITNLDFKQVATANLQIDYLLMPELLNDWCKLYGNPYLIIENNEGAGQSVADQMYKTYEYENLHFDSSKNQKNKVKAKKKYPGTRTTKTSRNLILKTLKTFTENNQLEINDADTIKQLFSFVLKDNKYQADGTSKDDCVMSLALAFTIFNNADNFLDMKTVVDTMKSQEESEVDISKILTIGSFDIVPEKEKPNNVITYEGFDTDEFGSYSNDYNIPDDFGDFDPNDISEFG